MNNNPDPIDSIGYKAWDEFYTHQERTLHRNCGRNNYWQNRYYKSFRKIGSICFEHQIDVVDFIVVNFRTIEKNNKYILPSDFAKVEALNRYVKYKNTYAENGRESAIKSWKDQAELIVKLTFKLIPTIYDDEYSILLAPNIPLAPWFRVFYTKQAEPGILAQYGEATWFQLKQDSGLRALARQLNPDTYRQLEQSYGLLGVESLENI